ncbi:MAG: hypothetical protein KAR45_14645 [Desulfobacteraceae bacterium]|nr:hypothetical protein [Desulfobacteraceae bacterium]
MKKLFLLILGFCLMVNVAFASSLTPVIKEKKAKHIQSTAVKTFVPVEIAPAIRVSIDLIRTLGVKSPGTPAYWQAEVRNIGLGDIVANTLKIKARQSHMQSPAQPATATFAVIHAMRPGQKRGFQGNWTPITGCTHLEIIVMDNNNRVLARKMHLVEFPRFTPPAKKLAVPKQPLQMQKQMYIKVAKIKHVNHMGSPVEGRDYTWQARCEKLVSGDLPSNRVCLFFDLSNSETGARIHIGSFHYGRTIDANLFTIRYTFKYREAYDTITLRMYDSVTKKTISEQSVNCAPFT